MRPRKTILLVVADERELGIQRFMLEVRGYRVVGAQSVEDAFARYAPDIDLVLGMAGGDRSRGPVIDWNALARQVKALCRTVPVLLAGPLLNVDELSAAADRVLSDKRLPAARELLEHVRVMVRRKRGPREKLELAPMLAAVAGD